MTSSPASSSALQEYSIRVPKNLKKRYHVMRFNNVLNIDFTKWSQVKMERENNMKEFKTTDEDQPKFGAGSEYGREAREEARRKKHGIIMKKYKPDDQPWIMKVGGKTGKKFKGIREGGVNENASFYVFTHGSDGIEAYPLNEWYNFHPIQRYKSLSAEEAEQEFGRRNKVMNYFSLMMRKRLRNEADVDGEEGEEGKTRKGSKKHSNEFKLTEMDDWVDSDEDLSESGNEGDDDEKKERKPKKKKKAVVGKKKKKAGSDDSAVEESDDGDEEGRELDYISDSSPSESDSENKAVKEMKSVAEESALRRLLASDDDEEEEGEGEKEGGEKEGGPDKEEKEPAKDKKRKRSKQKGETAPKKEEESSSDSSGASSDSDSEAKLKSLPSGGESRSASPSPGDKKAEPSSSSPPAKRPKLDGPSTLLLSSGGDNGITEEAVRRYLMRKPMTATELLQKFKGRKTGLTSEQLVNVMTQILKRINPVKQTIKTKMYLSIKQ